MPPTVVLASGSEIRARLLRAAGLDVAIDPARIDEESLRRAMDAEGLSSRDQADALAETKARRVANRHPDALVIGSDQILDLDGEILGKPADTVELEAQMRRLMGRTHRLLTAAVAVEGGEPVWRHVSEVRLTMRPLSDAFLSAYLERNADSLKSSLGGYKLEEEGIRLFTRIDGDYHAGLGLPLLPLVSWLADRGVIDT